MKNNIRVERAIKNMTQAELASRVAVSRQTIITIESNKYVPSTLLALKIARVFGKTVEEIFSLEESDLSRFAHPHLAWKVAISPAHSYKVGISVI